MGTQSGEGIVGKNEPRTGGIIGGTCCILGVRAAGGGSETGTPRGKHCGRRRLLEQNPGRQETPKRGPDLDAGAPTGLVQTPAKRPRRRESTGKWIMFL